MKVQPPRLWGMQPKPCLGGTETSTCWWKVQCPHWGRGWRAAPEPAASSPGYQGPCVWWGSVDGDTTVKAPRALCPPQWTRLLRGEPRLLPESGEISLSSLFSCHMSVSSCSAPRCLRIGSILLIYSLKCFTIGDLPGSVAQHSDPFIRIGSFLHTLLQHIPSQVLRFRSPGDPAGSHCLPTRMQQLASSKG